MRLTIIILAFLLAGCATQKRCNKKFPPQETITETIVYRDTIVYINVPGELVTDTVKIESPIDLNLPERVLQTEFCFARAWITNNLLMFELQQKEIEKEIVFKDVIIEKEIIVETVKEVNKLTRWQEFKGYLGVLFLVLLGGWLVSRFL